MYNSTHLKFRILTLACALLVCSGGLNLLYAEVDRCFKCSRGAKLKRKTPPGVRGPKRKQTASAPRKKPREIKAPLPIDLGLVSRVPVPLPSQESLPGANHFSSNSGGIINLNSILSTPTNLSEDLLRDGEFLFAAGKHSKAGEKYKAILKLNPNDTRAHIGMGDVHMAKGRHSEAIKSYKRAFELDPRNTTLSARLTEAIAIEKERDKANRDEWIVRALGFGASVAVGSMQNSQFKQQQLQVRPNLPTAPTQLVKKQ